MFVSDVVLLSIGFSDGSELVFDPDVLFHVPRHQEYPVGRGPKGLGRLVGLRGLAAML